MSLNRSHFKLSFAINFNRQDISMHTIGAIGLQQTDMKYIVNSAQSLPPYIASQVKAVRSITNSL